MSKNTEVLTLDELSKYVKISKGTLYKYTMAKRIPCFKIGVRLRFRKDSIDKWILGMEKANAPK